MSMKRASSSVCITLGVIGVVLTAMFPTVAVADDGMTALRHISPPAESLSGRLVFQTESGGAIYVINADGSGLRYLTNGMDPVLSPDGQQVAFTRWNNDQRGALGSVWVINVDGSGERCVLGDIAQPKSPTWSPPGDTSGARLVVSMQSGGRLEQVRQCESVKDHQPALPQGAFDLKINMTEHGPEICYSLPPHPQWGLRLIDIAQGSYQDLPRDIFSYTPSWDPANPWRVVYRGDRGLVSLDLNQGTTWALTSDVNDHAPVFSPDGQRIAVSYRQHDHWEVHVLNADGSGRVRLTETSLVAQVEAQIKSGQPLQPLRVWNNVAPAWSPDGSHIAFLTDRTGRWEIWVMQADGSHQRPMFSDAVNDRIHIVYNSVDERVLSWR